MGLGRARAVKGLRPGLPDGMVSLRQLIVLFLSFAYREQACYSLVCVGIC